MVYEILESLDFIGFQDFIRFQDFRRFQGFLGILRAYKTKITAPLEVPLDFIEIIVIFMRFQ